MLSSFANTIIFNIIGSPPTPSRPTIVEVRGNTVTIEWSQSVCDGGHTPESYTIRYKRSSSYSSYSYLYSITQKRYKITGLTYSTSYQFSVRTTSVDSRSSSFSSFATISTLPRGINTPYAVLSPTCQYPPSHAPFPCCTEFEKSHEWLHSLYAPSELMNYTSFTTMQLLLHHVMSG